MTRALVTGFEPFGGERVNASFEAVRRLPAVLGTIVVTTAQLPTSYGRSIAVLESLISSTIPDIVLCVGQAADRAAVCMERIAINLQDARIADNDGVAPADAPIVPGGPAAYFATLPIKATVAALQAASLPAAVSNSAGTFVCNQVFYGLMHHAATRGLHFRGGLLHVPRLKNSADNVQPAIDVSAAMALDDIVRGIVIVLEVAAGSL
jgi:pyroglutamyl-peptidase